jgi:hypothetical protein
MAFAVIDEFPTRADVLAAGGYRIVEWHLFLRPTMTNDELDIVKAIAQRYERLPASTREAHGLRARREHRL